MPEEGWPSTPGFQQGCRQVPPFYCSPLALFSPQLRLGNNLSCLIIKSRENKRRWSGGEEEREKGYKSCDLDVQYFGFTCLNLSCVKTFCA